MQITFSQSGGFVGLPRGCTIDTATLPPAERERLESLVAASGLDASWERSDPAGRDRRRYDIAIEAAGRTVRVCCDDGCLPESAKPLVAFLAGRAAQQPLPMGRRWGRFEGKVVAEWDDGGRDMTLVQPFAYVDPRQERWAAPAGAVVNGASIPRPFWSFIGGPFSGRFRNASVVHDVACVARVRPWRDVHRMFYEACRCGRVAVVKAKTMYYAVHHFGPRWRIEERRTLVAGRETVERVVHDETPPPPSHADVEAIRRYFAGHDVSADAIPTLAIPPSR
jgi:hypothetical protein